MEHSKRNLVIDVPQGFEPTIGRWIWSLEDTRRQTKETLLGLDQKGLDWEPAPNGNSIGSLLYHIALIELDWLYTEALERPAWPYELKKVFTIPDRDQHGRLSVVKNTSLAEHLWRLDLVRGHLITGFCQMSLLEFQRIRRFPQYNVTPEWVLYHIMEHEIEHRGHIQMVKTSFMHAYS